MYLLAKIGVDTAENEPSNVSYAAQEGRRLSHAAQEGESGLHPGGQLDQEPPPQDARCGGGETRRPAFHRQDCHDTSLFPRPVLGCINTDFCN